jgi:cytochrome c oxidase subunit 2
MRRFAARRLCVLGLLLCATGCAAWQGPSQKFVVFFQQWSAALDDPAFETVRAAANWANAHPNASIVVNGYADPTGSQQANIDMSRTRAQLVVDQLVRDGVPRPRIRLAAHGPTDFTLSALESRRVEIVVIGG